MKKQEIKKAVEKLKKSEGEVEITVELISGVSKGIKILMREMNEMSCSVIEKIAFCKGYFEAEAEAEMQGYTSLDIKQLLEYFIKEISKNFKNS